MRVADLHGSRTGRWAMNRWDPTGISKSVVAITYQDGIFFHAAACDFSSNAATVMGR